MQQLVYAMNFKSKAVPGDNPNRLHVRGEVASSSVTTIINDGGLTGGFDPAAVAPAHFDSEVSFVEGGAFTEAGTITLGNSKHRFHFSSVNPGWMNQSPQQGVMQGTITWKVDGGEGQFNGAQGIITSNFTVDAEGEVSDYQLGVIYIP